MRGMPDGYETKYAGEDGEDGQAFEDLTWAFPECSRGESNP